MPNVINGTSTGSGGLITSGDDSGILNIQTNETTAIAIDASQAVTIQGLTVGKGAGAVATNTAVGASALAVNTTGSAGVAVGYQALASNTTASNNTAVGYQAGYTNTTGIQKTSVGALAGYSGTASTSSTCIGYYAGYNTTGTDNTLIGTGAGYLITSGAKNTVLGEYSGNQGGLDIRTASNQIVLSDGDGNPRGVFNSQGTFSIKTSGSLSAVDGVIYLENTVSSWLTISNTTIATTQYFNAFRYNGTTIGSINGTNTSVQYNTTSDYRLKNSVLPMTGALAKVALLKPCTYKWNLDGSYGEGFIAHELKEVCPLAVTGEKDAINQDGSIKAQSIDTSYLVATLTAAIQELKAEFDAYKASHP